MNPKIKGLWLEALRSGEYKQGTSALHKVGPEGKDLYCCLGVLCEVAAKEGVVSVDVNGPCICGDESCNPAVKKMYDGSTTFLPESVKEWAGLDNDSPNVTIVSTEKSKSLYSGDRFALAVLNDDHMLTFEEIADLIEASL